VFLPAKEEEEGREKGKEKKKKKKEKGKKPHLHPSFCHSSPSRTCVTQNENRDKKPSLSLSHAKLNYKRSLP